MMNPLTVSVRRYLFILALSISSSGIIHGQSIDLDKQLGAENAKIVEVQIGLVPDEELTGYVSSVGKRLVAAMDELTHVLFLHGK